MYITPTRHSIEQLSIRKPGKSLSWMLWLFETMIKCSKKKEVFRYAGEEFEVKRYCRNDAWKIGCGKYWFVYAKKYEEYVIITFLVKENTIYINNKKYNLNIDSKSI